jgi:hypothetical protein
MEGSVATKEAPPEPAASFDGNAEATRTTEELFQWSTYVHVGTGAAGCKHGEDGGCVDPRHFHCWLTMPNVFQQRDIQDKAQAAKARKRRTLHDEESDARIVLEEQIEAWGSTEESMRLLIDRLADQRVRPEWIEIRHRLVDTDRFEHIDADIEELTRLIAVPEDERDADEFARLDEHVKAFRDEYEGAIATQVGSEVARLTAMPKAEVLDLERANVIDYTCGESFLNTMYTWTYYACARKPVENGYPEERAFPRPESLKAAPPEVVVALRDAYRELEMRMSRGDAAGN